MTETIQSVYTMRQYAGQQTIELAMYNTHQTNKQRNHLGSTYSSFTLANFSFILCKSSSYFFVIASSPSLGTSNFIDLNSA